MNSDNSALGGVTLDYGPFAFMERYEPYYNPWVGGGRPYSYGMQMEAAATNLGSVAAGGASSGLAHAFAELALHLLAVEGKRGGGGGGGEGRMSKAEVLASLRRSKEESFRAAYQRRHDDNCRAKLGLAAWDDEAQQLWDSLFTLMASRCGGGGVDFTIFFRALGEAEPAEAGLVRGALAQAALQPTAQVRPALLCPAVPCPAVPCCALPCCALLCPA